jgi:hypothetical protein
MVIHYPVPQHAHRSILWLLIATLILASLFVALQTASQPVVVRIAHPAAISDSPTLLHPIPVPEPPQSQAAHHAHPSVTPVPPGAEFHPIPQPVPMPPSGH